MKPDQDYAVITSGQPATNGGEPEAEGLSQADRYRLGGLDEETQSLIEPEDRLDPDAVPVRRELSRSPLPRTVFVLGVVGVFVVFGFLIALIAGLGRGRSPQVADRPKPTNDVIDPTQSDVYKGRLALTEQQRDQQQRNANAGAATPSSPRPQASPTASRPQPAASAAPAPAPRPDSVAPAPAPRPVQAVQSTAPAPIRTAIPNTSVREEDPMAQWSRLAGLGSAKAEVDKQSREIENSTGTRVGDAPGTAAIGESRGVNSFNSTAPMQNGQRAGVFTSEVIGDGSIFPSFSDRAMTNALSSPVLVAASTGFSGLTPDPMSPGMRGILGERDESEEIAARNHQVALGTSAAAEVAVPMYWEPSGNNQQNGRFAVTLKEALLSTTGEVALPAGSIFITEATGVNDQSRIVNQTVVAVVYQGYDGELRQEPVQPGVIVIRGQNNQPLIAEMTTQRGNVGDDLKIGLFGAIGRAGELINQGDVFSSASTSEGLNSSSSTVVNRRSNRTNILAAALDGFFNPLRQRMERRAQEQVEQDNNRTPILVVNQGSTVSVFVNGLLEIAP